jgi:hypothetical protein
VEQYSKIETTTTRVHGSEQFANDHSCKVSFLLMFAQPLVHIRQASAVKIGDSGIKRPSFQTNKKI